MANRIFLAFANSRTHPLPSLKEEDDKLYEFLSEREQKNHFKLHRDSQIDLNKLGRYLDKLRNEIVLFHFSGHAGRDQLFLEDQPAMANGIANFLSKCPNLKLVVLNGCSTQEQALRLHDLPSKPVVVGTSAPVGDQTATVFSTAFYQQLCQQEKSVQEAFDFAFSQAQLQKNDLSITKGLVTSKKKEAVWGIFSASQSRLDWKLPYEDITKSSSDFIPNQLLIAKLLPAFAPYQEKAKKQLELGEAAREADKVKALLEPLPLPISEQLRKLMTREQLKSEHIFFDKIGKNRLKQIGISYSTTIELLAFTLLAELWDLLLRQPKIEIAEKEIADLKHFISLDYNDQAAFSFSTLLQQLRSLLAKNDTSFFIEELAQVPDFDDATEDFGQSIAYLEELKNTEVLALEDQEVHHRCIKGEEHLATFFSQLAFLTQYSIRSVKSIDVQQYRHSKAPNYRHRIVKLIQNFVNILQEDREDRAEIMNTASIFLAKLDSKGKPIYLNLSPFIIDENAFNAKADLAKLHYFKSYENVIDNFVYKHVYKPNDKQLEISENQQAYPIIKDQFNAFTQLLFNQSIDAL